MSIYTPGIPPVDPKDLPAFLLQEFNSIRRAMNEADEFHALTPLAVEPSKQFDGMEVLADGTNWDPGSGAGRYYYLNSAWHFMG